MCDSPHIRLSTRSVRPNPSLHPTCYSRLRRLLPAGELQRWASDSRRSGRSESICSEVSLAKSVGFVRFGGCGGRFRSQRIRTPRLRSQRFSEVGCCAWHRGLSAAAQGAKERVIVRQGVLEMKPSNSLPAVAVAQFQTSRIRAASRSSCSVVAFWSRQDSRGVSVVSIQSGPTICCTRRAKTHAREQRR